MSIRWEEPYHDGGSKIIGYWVEKKERNTILWVKENKVPCLECNYKVTGLVEGLEYQFRTYALNAAGVSKASEASRPMMAQNPVGMYQNLRVYSFRSRSSSNGSSNSSSGRIQSCIFLTLLLHPFQMHQEDQR